MRSPRSSASQVHFEQAQRLELARERLASSRPGGSPATAMSVTSAAVIEPRATTSMPCPHCGGQFRVLEHTRPVPRLRRLDVECRHCGTPRALWFTIESREPN